MSIANATSSKLSAASNPPSADVPAWSGRLAERYGLSLSEDLADWFDQEIWRRTGSGEYRLPVDAGILLGSTPEVVWPALMPADLLPVLGSPDGDWLCLRVDAEGRAAEIVQWYHGGGDWLPWGRNLAEAILLDAVVDRLPGPGRRHAVPAEKAFGGVSIGGDPLLAWAASHLPEPVTRFAWGDAHGRELAEALLASGVAETAVRCELVQAALAHPAAATLSPQVAQRHGLDWNRALEWTFDPQRIPAEERKRLAEASQADSAVGDNAAATAQETDQDWQAVEQHCRRVTETHPELAWAWNLAGYARQRCGDLVAAADAYRSGVTKSVFTDQSIRLGTHWSDRLAAKFSAAMLGEIAGDTAADSEYLRRLADPDPAARRRRVTCYWQDQAERAAEAGRPGEAIEHAVAAGWDLGAESLGRYGELLESVVRFAEAAGQAARAELARTHRACLRQRYAM